MLASSLSSALSNEGSVLRARPSGDRKSTRLNSSHTVIYSLSLHDALPIYVVVTHLGHVEGFDVGEQLVQRLVERRQRLAGASERRSEEHTSELQSHRDLLSFPTRRSSDLRRRNAPWPRRRLRCWRAACPAPCRTKAASCGRVRA